MIALIVSQAGKEDIKYRLRDDIKLPHVGEHVMIETLEGDQDVCITTLIVHGYLTLTKENTKVYANYIKTVKSR